MKIVVLGTRGFPGVQGGVEKHCENLYPRLVEKGCEVVVFTREPYVNSAIDNYKGVKLIPLPCPKNKFLEAFVHTFIGVFAAKKLRPDIVHFHAIGPSLFVPLARMLGLKVVMTYHGPEYKRAKWKGFPQLVLRLAEVFACKNANSLIAVAKGDAEDVAQRFGRQVVAIPNGVVLPELKNEIASSAPSVFLRNDGAPVTGTTLQRFGVEKGKYVLAVGRFVPEKGFDVLMEAFGIASSFGKSSGRSPEQSRRASSPACGGAPRNDTGMGMKGVWKLVIVGDADHEDAYSRRLKEKAKENPDIVLPGFLSGEPLRELYSNAGLFVLPSYYEGLPIVLLEALSYGLSCIVSDIPANREVGLEARRYFKPGDNKGLAEKLQEFIAKPLSSEEQNKQRQIIAKDYNWQEIAQRTLEVYQNIA